MAWEGTRVFPAALQPGTEVGRWRVLGTLGLGGYGAVYRVESLDVSGRSFALKLSLHPDATRAPREMALLLDRACHPNVVRVHALGRWPDPVDGLPYFVMDLVEGLALHTWAETLNPTFRQLVMVGGSVARTLGALHARGVLHRDLKPEHLLVREREQVPVLIDFGAGDQAGAATLTTTPLPPGTPHLRSPEAIRFQQSHWRQPELRYPYTVADDVYALGVCLYRAVTGHYPFSPDQEPDLLTVAILERLPPSPRDINPRVPEPLAKAILRMLEKEPEQRPLSGEDAHSGLMRGLLGSDSDAFDSPLFEVLSGKPREIHRPVWPARPYEKSAPRRRSAPAPAAAKPAAKRGASWGWAGLAACLGLLLASPGTWEVLARGWTQDTTQQVSESLSTSRGHKLAKPMESPHSVSVAVPPTTGPPPATVAPVAAKPQERVPVPPPSPVSPSRAPTTPKPSNALKTAAIASCAVGMACASTTPPLMDRPPPPAEQCPPEAIAAMRDLNVMGRQWSGAFDYVYPSPRQVTVREGRAIVYSAEAEGRIKYGSSMNGTLYVSANRVYGRFTQLRMGDDSTIYPVCIELWHLDDRLLGLPRKPGGNETTAVVDNHEVSIRSVDEFQ
jgi:eukaryotic-like serine/threonine-protein kinase